MVEEVSVRTGTITVDDSGTKLFYRDSGIPKSHAATYSTIFIIHGIHFNSGQFSMCHPLFRLPLFI